MQGKAKSFDPSEAKWWRSPKTCICDEDLRMQGFGVGWQGELGRMGRGGADPVITPGLWEVVYNEALFCKTALKISLPPESDEWGRVKSLGKLNA